MSEEDWREADEKVEGRGERRVWGLRLRLSIHTHQSSQQALVGEHTQAKGHARCAATRGGDMLSPQAPLASLKRSGGPDELDANKRPRVGAAMSTEEIAQAVGKRELARKERDLSLIHI